MLKFLSRLKQEITGELRLEKVDAKRVYSKIMKQSRNPAFYSESLLADDTDARMEWLSAHLSVLVQALSVFGEDGAILSQAVYDVMVEDFDIALREEGLSDSGVKHRIKPLAKMYLTRLRSYSKALAGENVELYQLVEKHVLRSENSNKTDKLVTYLSEFSGMLSTLSLDQIAKSDFCFPEFNVTTI